MKKKTLRFTYVQNVLISIQENAMGNVAKKYKKEVGLLKKIIKKDGVSGIPYITDLKAQSFGDNCKLLSANINKVASGDFILENEEDLSTRYIFKTVWGKFRINDTDKAIIWPVGFIYKTEVMNIPDTELRGVYGWMGVLNQQELMRFAKPKLSEEDRTKLSKLLYSMTEMLIREPGDYNIELEKSSLGTSEYLKIDADNGDVRISDNKAYVILLKEHQSRLFKQLNIDKDEFKFIMDNLDVASVIAQYSATNDTRIIKELIKHKCVFNSGTIDGVNEVVNVYSMYKELFNKNYEYKIEENDEDNATNYVYLIQPMLGRTKKEILDFRKKLEKKIKENWEIIDTYIPNGDKMNPIEALGTSLQKMAKADIVYVVIDDTELNHDTYEDNIRNSRGCSVELEAAIKYGKPIILIGKNSYKTYPCSL